MTDARLQRLNQWDFFDALMCALRLRGVSSFRWDTRGRDSFTRAVYAAYRRLVEMSGQLDLDVVFVIQPHPLWGDSAVVERCVHSAMGLLISFDTPDFRNMRISLGEVDARHLLYERSTGRIPGTPELYDQLAQVFLDELYSPPTRLARAV